MTPGDWSNVLAATWSSSKGALTYTCTHSQLHTHAQLHACSHPLTHHSLKSARKTTFINARVWWATIQVQPSDWLDFCQVTLATVRLSRGSRCEAALAAAGQWIGEQDARALHSRMAAKRAPKP